MTIVSLSVRYASADVDEFIEHHAADVSARGIYIKTERAIALGTLIEFEVKIAGNKPVLAGAGRVVWARDASSASAERPPGIGVRIIELDETSQANLERLLSRRKDAGKRFEEEPEVVSRVPRPPPGAETSGANPAPTAAASPARRPSRAGTPAKTNDRPLPPVAAPPRRSTVPPRPEEEVQEEKDEDKTVHGPMPNLPKGRNSTLVGIGAPTALPRVTPPPRRGGSLAPPAPRPGPSLPKVTPPPARPTPAPPRATEKKPPTPAEPSLQPPQRTQPAEPPDVDDDGQETLFQSAAEMRSDDDGERTLLQPAAEARPEPAIPVDVETAEPEPTVIVPRDSPVPEPPPAAPAESAGEDTGPRSEAVPADARAGSPRDQGDTQRIRRRGRQRRAALLGGLVVAGLGTVFVAMAFRTSAPASGQPRPSGSPTASASSPSGPAMSGASMLVEASTERAGDDGGVPAPAAQTPEKPTSATEAPPAPQPSAVTSAAAAPPQIEFSALPIERPAPRPARTATTAETPAPSAKPTATSPPVPSAPARPSPAAAPTGAGPASNPAPNCNPTYTVDSEGNKHFKPECFVH